MGRPKVAILMPSLNHEKYVEQAVESVFSQNYSNTVLIVCDDASTDGNFLILERLSRKYSFLLLRNETRQGVIRTLNRCFEQCSDADYYYCLASDDVLRPGIIENCLEEMKRWPSAGMILGSHIVIDANGNPTGSSRRIGSPRVITLESVWENYHLSFQFQRGDFTRSVYPMCVDGNAEDRYLFLSCIMSSFKVIQTDIPFILRRIHGANLSLSDEGRLSADDGWDYFTKSPGWEKKRSISLRRHMLCCLALANSDKSRFKKLFASDGISVYYLLFIASYFPPLRWTFLCGRKLEKIVRRAFRF
jgi:glycosyltransferase involved in cell wall biosynthesis